MSGQYHNQLTFASRGVMHKEMHLMTHIVTVNAYAVYPLQIPHTRWGYIKLYLAKLHSQLHACSELH